MEAYCWIISTKLSLDVAVDPPRCCERAIHFELTDAKCVWEQIAATTPYSYASAAPRLLERLERAKITAVVRIPAPIATVTGKSE